MHRLLITGGSGFVGKNLTDFFSGRWRVIATYLTHPDIATGDEAYELDITDAEMVHSVLRRAKPEVVIHAAGNKDVRFCEDNPDEAHRVNAIGTQNVAAACRALPARMIYLSTDLVFECTRGNYAEDEVPNTELVYGKSKLEGERLAVQELDDVAICRSAGIYGPGSPLLKWLQTKIATSQTVEAFVDVFNSPTYSENLGEMLDAIIHRKLSGVFHTAGRERVNRFDFFRAYASTFDLDASLITPSSLGHAGNQVLLRPDSSLSVNQTAAKLGVPFDSITEGLQRLRAHGGM
jgi:dTDP-4-dehydrorhamnose reductase